MAVSVEVSPGAPGFAGGPDFSKPPNHNGVLALMRKDVAAFISRDRFLIALVYLLGHPMTLPNEEAFFWLGISLACALALYVPTIEWHQETDRMLSSLPVRRATVVLSRYFSSVMAVGLAGLAWVSSGRLLAPLLDVSATSPGMWTTFDGVLTFFLMAGLIVSLFLPLYFRFGLGRGATLFVGFSAVLYLFASVRLVLVIPGDALRDRVTSLSAAVGPGWVLLLVLLGLGVVVAGSEQVSVRWFERRDL